MKTGVELIAEERQRQIEVEGWTSEHDSKHIMGELSDAAACYAIRGYWRARLPFELIWPFDLDWFKPALDGTKESRIKELQKAGALIAAEIDRINNRK